MLEATGKTGEAVATYRRSESLLAGAAGTDPAARCADCRSQLGGLLSSTGQAADAMAAFRQARADQEVLAAAPGAPATAGRDLADTVNRIGDRTVSDGQADRGGGRGPPALEIRRSWPTTTPPSPSSASASP